MLEKVKSFFSKVKDKVTNTKISLPKANSQVQFEFTEEGVKVKEKKK